MIKKILIPILLVSSILLNADDITSLSADTTSAEPDLVVNLTLDLIVTKKYKIKLSSYDNATGTKLNPSFEADDVKHVKYTVPSIVEHDIKIVAELIEKVDGADTVVGSKEILLNANNGCEVYVYVTTHGLYQVDSECTCSFFALRPGGQHQHINVRKNCVVEINADWHNCCNESAKTLLCKCN